VRKSRYTAEQVATALKDYDAKVPVENICKQLDISIATFYNWRKKYQGLSDRDLETMIQIQEEYRMLKQRVDDLIEDRDLLQSIIARFESGTVTKVS